MNGMRMACKLHLPFSVTFVCLFYSGTGAIERRKKGREDSEPTAENSELRFLGALEFVTRSVNNLLLFLQYVSSTYYYCALLILSFLSLFVVDNFSTWIKYILCTHLEYISHVSSSSIKRW